MRLTVYLWFLFLSLLVADEKELTRPLVSEKFDERQNAEKELIAWAQEEQTEQRAEELLELYLASDDPEEFCRLTNILLAVHFDLKKNEIPQKGPGFIGISMGQRVARQFQPQRFEQGQLQNGMEPQKGVFIDSVIEGTPAEKAGLLAGDIITEIDGQSIAGVDPPSRLKEIVGGKPPGTKISLTVEREKEVLKKIVTLMNGKAVPQIRAFGDQPRVDQEKAAELLKEDYLGWLIEQRAIRRKE